MGYIIYPVEGEYSEYISPPSHLNSTSIALIVHVILPHLAIGFRYFL